MFKLKLIQFLVATTCRFRLVHDFYQWKNDKHVKNHSLVETPISPKLHLKSKILKSQQLKPKESASHQVSYRLGHHAPAQSNRRILRISSSSILLPYICSGQRCWPSTLRRYCSSRTYTEVCSTSRYSTSWASERKQVAALRVITLRAELLKKAKYSSVSYYSTSWAALRGAGKLCESLLYDLNF